MLPPKSPKIATYLLTAMQTTHTYTFPWDQKSLAAVLDCLSDFNCWMAQLSFFNSITQLNNSKPENYCSLPQIKALVLWCQVTVLHLCCSLMQHEGACHPVGRAEKWLKDCDMFASMSLHSTLF